MRFAIGIISGCVLAVALVYLLGVTDSGVAMLIGLPCGFVCMNIALNIGRDY